MLTLVNFERNGPGLGAGAAAVLALAAAVVLDELLLLLELPQPARVSATPAMARIDVLGTRFVSWCVENRARRSDQHTARCRAPSLRLRGPRFLPSGGNSSRIW